MTDFTPLSPAAQAVFNAYLNAPCGKPRQSWVAAALRAAVDRAVPEHREHYPNTLDEQWRKISAFEVRDRFLAIAAELENND